MAETVVTLKGVATPPGIAHRYGITVATVHGAIRTGRLPAVRVAGSDGNRSVWLIRIADAEQLWGLRRASLDADAAAETVTDALADLPEAVAT